MATTGDLNLAVDNLEGQSRLAPALVAAVAESESEQSSSPAVSLACPMRQSATVSHGQPRSPAEAADLVASQVRWKSETGVGSQQS